MDIFFDGSSKGNPGRGASGWIIHHKEKSGTIFGWQYHSKCTNNESEYKALILALTKALYIDGHNKRICVYGDSLLVIKQMNGQYKVRKPNLIPLFHEANSIVNQLRARGVEVLLSHVPRAKNTLADYLSNVPLQIVSKKKCVQEVEDNITSLATLKRTVAHENQKRCDLDLKGSS